MDSMSDETVESEVENLKKEVADIRDMITYLVNAVYTNETVGNCELSDNERNAIGMGPPYYKTMEN